MLAGIAALIALGLVAMIHAIGYIGLGVMTGGEWVMTWIKKRRDKRIARIEAELDRTQDELRATILKLAHALGAEAHEARMALIRESYLASGTVPGCPTDS